MKIAIFGFKCFGLAVLITSLFHFAAMFILLGLTDMGSLFKIASPDLGPFYFLEKTVKAAIGLWLFTSVLLFFLPYQSLGTQRGLWSWLAMMFCVYGPILGSLLSISIHKTPGDGIIGMLFSSLFLSWEILYSKHLHFPTKTASS